MLKPINQNSRNAAVSVSAKYGKLILSLLALLKLVLLQVDAVQSSHKDKQLNHVFVGLKQSSFGLAVGGESPVLPYRTYFGFVFVFTTFREYAPLSDVALISMFGICLSRVWFEYYFRF